MTAQLRYHPLARFARRTLLIWLIEVTALVGVALFVPGVELEGILPAIEFTAFVGILNALLWPLLARLTLPFMVFSFGFFTFILNGFMFWLGGQMVAGVHFSGYHSALLAAISVTVVNTTASGLLTIDEDATFYRAVLRRAMRRMPTGQSNKLQPGVIFLEIDGLSEPTLRRALRDGYMPNLARWLERGSHSLIEWESDLSCQTGAAQAGILHGDNFNIPAFRWVEKANGNRVMSAHGLRDAAIIEQRITDGNGLLARAGRSRANLFSGDAEDTMMTYSRITHFGQLYAPAYFTFFSNPYNFVRALTLMAADMVREVVGLRRQIREDVWPRLEQRRRGIYPLIRAATTILLRDITLDTLIGDVLESKADVVYASFMAYDEVAHHAGVEDRDALYVLYQLDRAFARVERAVSEVKRPYELVVLSDHGQSQGATFKQRYGQTLKEFIQSLLPAELKIHERLQTNEDWGHVGALISETAQQDQRMLGRVVRGVTRRRRREGEVPMGPEYRRRVDEQAGRAVRAEEAQTIVLASGNLGLVYFTDWQERLTLEQMEQLFPALISGLVRHSGIGFVMVRSARHGPLAIGARGVYYLAQDRVEGDNPLAVFSLNAPMHLRRADLYDYAPDILVNSYYDPVLDEGCAFEELIGFHGGLGGNQGRPFVLAPSYWQLNRERQIIGAEQLHRVLKRRLPHLAEPRPATGDTVESVVAATP